MHKSDQPTQLRWNLRNDRVHDFAASSSSFESETAPGPTRIGLCCVWMEWNPSTDEMVVIPRNLSDLFHGSCSVHGAVQMMCAEIDLGFAASADH